MLDFIVLGLVPGTNLQLAFGDVVRLSIIVVLTVVSAWELYSYKHSRKSAITDWINSIAL